MPAISSNQPTADNQRQGLPVSLLSSPWEGRVVCLAAVTSVQFIKHSLNTHKGLGMARSWGSCSFSIASSNQGQSRRIQRKRKHTDHPCTSAPRRRGSHEAWLRRKERQGEGAQGTGQVTSHHPRLQGGEPRSSPAGAGALWESFSLIKIPRWAQKPALDNCGLQCRSQGQCQEPVVPASPTTASAAGESGWRGAGAACGSLENSFGVSP